MFLFFFLKIKSIYYREKETELMEKEDIDVYSENVKPVSASHHHYSNPESRIDVESYNDF